MAASRREQCHALAPRGRFPPSSSSQVQRSLQKPSSLAAERAEPARVQLWHAKEGPTAPLAAGASRYSRPQGPWWTELPAPRAGCPLRLLAAVPLRGTRPHPTAVSARRLPKPLRAVLAGNRL